MPRVGTQGLMLVWLNVLLAATHLLVWCWAHKKDNETTELLGQVWVNRLVITGEDEKGASPPWQGEHMQPLGWDGECV